MSHVPRRRARGDDFGKHFKSFWETEYLFTDCNDEKHAKCLVCKKYIINRSYNIRRHYMVNHGEDFKDMPAAERRNFIQELKQDIQCEDPEEQQNIEGVMEMKLEVLEEDGDNRGQSPEYKHVVMKKRPPSESEYPPRKRKPTTDDDIMETRSFEYLPRDECSVYGEHIANEIRKLTPRAQIKTKHLINNIIYEAQMGMFDNPQASPRTSTQTSPTPPAYSTHSDETFPNEHGQVTDNCSIVKQEEFSD